MGQYHQTFALPALPNEKAQMFSHYSLSGGAKLCEQNYTWLHDPEYQVGGTAGPPTGPMLASPCAAATAVMISMGPWSSRRIVTIGDYHEGEYSELYGAGEALVEDITAEVTAITAEAFGFKFRSDGRSPWLELELPEDFKKRITRAQATYIHDPSLVLLATPGGGLEYLRPDAFESPPHPVASCMLGGLWPVALIMTAVSDGLGGGDANFEIPGRWAGARFAWLSQDKADEAGAVDITEWATAQAETRSHILAR